MDTTAIDRYRAAGSAFVVAARTASRGEGPKKSDEWDATMIAHHLADAEMHFAIRIREVLANENPVLPVFDEEKYAEHLNYADRPIEPALLVIKAIREETANLLATVSADSWGRRGTRVDGFEYTLADLVRISTEHIEEHISQVADEVKSAPGQSS